MTEKENNPAQGAPELPPLPAYDAGLLSDFGGGRVDWWQDYIRAELGRAHDFYESHFADRQARQAAPEAPRDVFDSLRKAFAKDVQMEKMVSAQLGRMVKEKDEDRIYWREQAEKAETALAASKAKAVKVEAKSLTAVEDDESNETELRHYLSVCLGRMDRARTLLTDGNPRPSCNWGMLDTTDIREALPTLAAEPVPVEAVSEDTKRLEQDAARYRYLRQHRATLLLTGFFGNGCVNRYREDADAAIDAAIAASPSSTKKQP